MICNLNKIEKYIFHLDWVNCGNIFKLYNNYLSKLITREFIIMFKLKYVLTSGGGNIANNSFSSDYAEYKFSPTYVSAVKCPVGIA